MRQLLQLVLLVQVRRRLEDPRRRDPDDEEREHHHAPALELLEQRGLEGGVGRSWLQRVGDVRSRLAGPLPERQPGDRGDRDQRRPRSRARSRPSSTVRASLSSAPIPAPRRRRPAAAGRSCRFRGEVRGPPRRCRPSPGRPTISMWKRSMPRGAGPSWYSPAWLYFEPWHGHSNHFDWPQNGTRQPRCTHRW